MKKKVIILWLASIVIVFITIYISNIVDEYYPITSTFGIEGKKISYRFEKEHYGKEKFNVIIRTDVAELKGKMYWKSESDTNWQSKELKKSDLILSESISVLKPAMQLNYFVELFYKDKKYILPDNKKVSLTFFGNIPLSVSVLEYLLLYLSLILAVRTGLEYFNYNVNSKKFGVLILIFFLTLIALINPLYLTYKYGFINTSIPHISKLFILSHIAIFIIWVVTVIAIFSSSKFKFLPLASSILTLLIFVLLR